MSAAKTRPNGDELAQLKARVAELEGAGR